MSSASRFLSKLLMPAQQIQKISIYQDRFIIARTANTLLAGDLESNRLSEVAWQGNGGEKFYFDNDRVSAALPA